jgi:nitroreductase
MSNPVIDCLLNHRTIRKYKDQPIEPEKVELILRAGIRAATGGNLQLYSFIVVDDPQKKKELDDAWPAEYVYIARSPLVIIGLVDQYRVKRWLEYHSDSEIVCNRPSNFFIGIWDCLIALQNMVVAAESMGMGTCYIGSIQEMDVYSILKVPKYCFPAGLVCMGYPDQNKQLSMRLPLEAVVHKNEYRLTTDDDILSWYKERDAVWERVSDERKEMLAKENIHGIAQALAVQKFSKKVVEERSKGIIENLERSGFDFGKR